MIELSATDFERVVQEALSEIPDDLLQQIDNVAVFVEEEPSAELLRSLEMDPNGDLLFGLYQGVAMPERGAAYSALPDRIVVFRQPLLQACSSRAELLQEIRLTVIHELGHYFGLDEEDLP